MNCPNCNSEIPQGASFCIKCGCKAPVTTVKKKSKKGLIAGIIAGASVLMIALIVGAVFLVKMLINKMPIPTVNDVTTETDENNTTTEPTISTPDDDNITTVKHTIMVYMIGSDLETKSKLASIDIQEMLDAEYGDDVRVVLQTGGATKWWTNGIENGKVQRFEVKSGELIELENLGKKNMSKVDTLSDFITYASTAFEAEKYTLVLWNHGGGIPISFGRDENYTVDILSDSEVGEALEAAGVQFESIVMDACNMCTLEVAMAVKDYAKYMVAAESTTMGTGMYYLSWLDYMGENSSASGSEYCEYLVSEYMDSIEEYDYKASMSYVKLSKVEAVYDAYEDYLVSVLDDIKEGYYVDYVQARNNCGLYNGTDSVDIITLATVYSTDKSSALINAVVNAVGYTESDYLYGHGLAAYSPFAYAELYEEARASMVTLDYGDDILDFFDAYVSLYLAYNGEDYVDEYAGTWYDSEIVSYYVEDGTESAEYEIDTSIVGGNEVIVLDDSDWEIISSIEVMVMLVPDENGDDIIYVGTDEYYVYDDYGNLLLEVPDNWVRLNGCVAPYTCINSYSDSQTGEWMQEGFITARCDGEDIIIYIYYDNDNPTGVITGYSYYDLASGSETEYGGTVFQFEDYDEIELMYLVSDIEGNMEMMSIIDETFYAKDLELTYEKLNWDDQMVVCIYTIYDIYGNEYETDSIIF